MSRLKYTVIIPARGGSKSIKNKNLQKINGKSLIRIAIEKFLSINSVSKVIVTSDDEKILNEAKLNGAISWARAKNISGDTAISESAIKEILEKSNLVSQEEHIIFHQCTSPLLSIQSIKNAITQFESSNCTSIFTVQEEYNPIWYKVGRGHEIFNKKDLNRKSRQERNPLFIETGGLYIINRNSFIKNFNRFGENPLPFVIPKLESIDIDEKMDLIMAQKLI